MNFWEKNNFYGFLIFAGELTNKYSYLISLKLAERSEAKNAKRNFASIFFCRWDFCRAFSIMQFASISYFKLN